MYKEDSVSRGKGRSPVKYAAYCHATKMWSEVEGPSLNHVEKASQLKHSEIALPERAPTWATEAFGVPALQSALEATQEREHQDTAIKAAWANCSERLWNSVELAERDLNRCFMRAKYANSAIISIPVELPLGQQIELTRGFVHSAYVQRGMCADWVIHDKDDGHPHVHVMHTIRYLGADGWGGRMPVGNYWDGLLERRGLWGQHANVSLSTLRVHDWVDHRNYGARGLNLVRDTASPHSAAEAEAEGNENPGRERAVSARKRNQTFLKKNPNHFVDILQASKNSFTEAELRQQVRKRMETSVTAAGLDDLCVTDDELKKLGDQAMASAALVQVEPCAPDGSPLYMTSARLTGLTDLKRASQSLAEMPLDHASLNSVTDAMHWDSLEPDQRAAAEAMASSERITLVQCRPEPGMVAALEQTARLWISRGFDLCGTALTGESMQNLANVGGLWLKPLARWEFLWSRKYHALSERTVFIVADAGMVDVAQWSRVLDRMPDSGGKLIALREPNRPLPSVGGSGWHSLEAGVGDSVSIGRTVEQRRTGDRMATVALERGGSGAQAAIEYYAREGAIRLGVHSKDPFAALASAYFDTGNNGESRIALGYSDSDVRKLNEAIRKEALRSGRLEAGSVRTYGEIEHIDRSDAVPRIRNVPLVLGPGDRIVFKQPHSDLGLPQYALGTLTAVHGDSVDVLMDGSSGAISLDLSTFRGVDYGYAMTLRIAESLKADHSFVLPHGSMHRHGMHVALTRHRESVTVIGRPGHVESLADLIHLAQTPGHLTVGHQDLPDIPREAPVRSPAGRSATEGSVRERSAHDLCPLVEPFAREGFGTGINALASSGLINVASRFVERLTSSSKKDAASLSGSLHRYARDPTLAIDDLLQSESVIRADDIAECIAEEIAAPEAFLRRFMDAMAHPDLVPVSNSDHYSGAPLYSTRSALRRDASALRRIRSLAETTAPESELQLSEGNQKPEFQGSSAIPQTIERPENISTNAIPCGLMTDRIQLIRCSDSYGRTEVASKLVRDHRRSGGRVIGLSPSTNDFSALKEAGLHDPMTVEDYRSQIRQGENGQDDNSLVILDGASRIGNIDALEVLEHKMAGGGKFVALLDDSSSAILEEGLVFRALELRLGATRTASVGRRSPNLSNLIQDLSLGGEKRSLALKALDNENVLWAGGNLRGAVERIAEDFVGDARFDRVAVARSQAEADAMNEAVRDRLDVSDPRRRPYIKESGGRLAGLRCGDRIRLMEKFPGMAGLSRSTAGSDPYGDSDSQTIGAGVSAEVHSRNQDGDLKLRFQTDEASQDLIIAPSVSVPNWRFAFAGTVESEMPSSRASVHVLVSHGMTRQSLLSAMDMHIQDLNVVVPVPISEKLEYLEETLKRSTPERIWPVFGFEQSLTAREAAQGAPPILSQRSDGIMEAVARIRRAAGLSDRALPEAFPPGIAGEVLADVLSASVLKVGEPPSGRERLAFEMLSNTFADFEEWPRILRQMPKSLPRQADTFARMIVGSETNDAIPKQASIAAMWMLVARMYGENGIADQLEAGLTLFGTRARIAGLYAKTEERAKNTADEQSQVTKGEILKSDVRSILADVPQAEEKAAYETLAAFGVRGADRIERVQMFETERQRGWDKWEGRERELLAERREREERKHRSDEAFVMACLVSQRVKASSPVHDLHLQSEILLLLTEAAEASDQVRGEAEPAAKAVARKRAEADLRVQIVEEVEGKHKFSIEGARYKGEPDFAMRETRETWRAMYAVAAEALSRREVEPTQLERLAAASSAMAETDERKQLANAITRALSFGSPDRDGDELRRDRASLMSELGTDFDLSDLKEFDKSRDRIRRLYESFTELEIRELAGGESGLAEELAPDANRNAVARNIKWLHGSRSFSYAPWIERYNARERSLEASRGRDRGISIELF